MKQLTVFVLLISLLLTGCSTKKQQPSLSYEERTDLLRRAHRSVRNRH